MRNVLVLVFSNLKHDARVARQVAWLRKKYDVTVVCFDAEDAPGQTVIRIKQTRLTPLRKALLGVALLSRAYGIAYRIFHDYRYLHHRLNGKFDLIIANDI